MEYTSIDRIFAKVVRDFNDEFSESDVIEWAAEALEFIGAVQEYEEVIRFTEVKNHQCSVPKGVHSIIQIAKDTRWCGPENNPICPKDVAPIKNQDQQPDIPVALNCQGEPENAYDLAYYRPFFDLKSEYVNWRRSDTYRDRFVPVMLSNSALYDSLVCKIQEDHVGDYGGSDKYTVIGTNGVTDNVIRFGFRDGFVAIAYNKQRTDEETGYPLVPDHASYTEAITRYVVYKVMLRRFYDNRAGSESRLQVAERDWQWYCRQAGNYSMMPKGVDQHQNYLNQRQYMIPRNNKYYGFFGSLSAKESRRWNDPDRRNNRGTLITL